MAVLDKGVQNKLVDSFIRFVKELPNWLRNALVVSLIIGICYFMFFQKHITYTYESRQFTELQEQVDKVGRKVKEIEDAKDAYNSIYNELLRMRRMYVALFQLHKDDQRIIIDFIKKSHNKDFIDIEKRFNENNIKYNDTVDKINNSRINSELDYRPVNRLEY